MITGVVQGREARIDVRVRGQRGRQRRSNAVIDTGFTGWLTLPGAAIAALGLPWQGSIIGVLADGSKSTFNVYDATVEWDGQPRRITVSESDADPLVGMALMSGYELKAQIRHGGRVTIKPLPKRKRRTESHE